MNLPTTRDAFRWKKVVHCENNFVLLSNKSSKSIARHAAASADDSARMNAKTESSEEIDQRHFFMLGRGPCPQVSMPTGKRHSAETTQQAASE
jgi:hypothetical protein